MGQEERQKGKGTKLGLFISRHYVRPEHEGKIVNTPDTALLARRKQTKGNKKHITEPASTHKTSQSVAQAIIF